MEDRSALVRLAEAKPFGLGVVEVDPPSRTLRREDGAEERVQPRVMQVLVLLARRAGDVVGREELNAGAWGGLQVGDDALNRVVARLRRHAAEIGAGSFSIETVPRVGFQLVGEVSPRGPAAVSTDRPAARLDRRALIAAGLGAAGLVAAGGAYALLGRRDGRPAGEPKLTRIAVLPFDYLGGESEARFLATSLPREVRDQLARVAGLQLIAEPSSRTAGAESQSPQAAGKRLRARYVVQGSVGVAARRIRVRANLIDVASGAVIASHAEEGDAARLFAIQDAICGALLRELVGRTGAATPAATSQAPRDSRAYRLVLEGQDLLEASRAARMDGRVEPAFDLADRAAAAAKAALDIDRDNPSALLLLAALTRNGWTREMAAQGLSADQRVEASIVLVTRALASEPNDPAALTALGDYYRRFRWRWAEAETLFRKALEINPSQVEAHWSYAYLLGTVGRAIEGLRHANTVFRLDPETTWRRVALPRLLYLAGERGRMLERYDVELRATPANLFLITEIYIVHLTENDPGAIDRLAATVQRLGKGRTPSREMSEMIAKLGEASAALRGRPEPFRARIAQQVAAYDADASGMATGQARASIDLLFLYAIESAWAGAGDQAITLLGRALAGRSLYWPATLPWGVAPFPAALRANPRFAALWSADPKLAELVRMRRRNLETGQTAGRTESGAFLSPSHADVRRALA